MNRKAINKDLFSGTVESLTNVLLLESCCQELEPFHSHKEMY